MCEEEENFELKFLYDINLYYLKIDLGGIMLSIKGSKRYF